MKNIPWKKIVVFFIVVGSLFAPFLQILAAKNTSLNNLARTEPKRASVLARKTNTILTFGNKMIRDEV